MKEQGLLFLGLLQEDGPKHGYQLKKLMHEISATFTGLKTDSTYYPLKKMLADGLVTQSIDKEGKRPIRYTYKVTEKGKEEFRKLLLRNILAVEKPYFSIDLSLYFFNYIPPNLRRRYLSARLQLLLRLKKGLVKLKENLTGKILPNIVSILEHNQELLEAEIKFIQRLSQSSVSQ
jgi:DNA-binding PadR family transcriptional regulator